MNQKINEDEMTIEVAAEKFEKLLDVRAEIIDVLSSEGRKIAAEGLQAESFLIDNAPEKLVEVYKSHKEKLDDMVGRQCDEQEVQTKKRGILKSVKEAFAFAAGALSIVGVLFTVVALVGSAIRADNLHDADKVYRGWLDSDDGKVLVEQLSDDYLAKYKTGEISYEKYIDNMNNVGTRENLEKYVSLPSAEPFLESASEAEDAAKVGRVCAIAALSVSVAGLITKLGIGVAEDKKCKKIRKIKENIENIVKQRDEDERRMEFYDHS
ncbi:MAG: hypothetical protein J6A28_02830 [Clostridia bacterium]|nr:hypothetical protein [Clostridia bacterium]